MKKIYLLVFSLLIFLSSTFSNSVELVAGSNSLKVLDLLSFNTPIVKAQVVEDDMIASPSSEVKEIADYQLPYPGLLPDSPLYFLRVTRDRIVSFLISDPKKKTEFDLLQADKRLNAGIYLFDKDKKKIELVLSTISKAENYFEEALANLKKAHSQGMDMTEIADKLKSSAVKHQEVLISLKEKAPKQYKESFEFQRKRAANFEKEVNEFVSK